MNVTSGPIQEEMDGLEEESYASGWESRYSEIIRLMAVCFSLISTIWLVLVALADRTSGASAHPRVSISNGSYHGLHNQKLKQDMFLGMPYAKPPTGDLRFRRPQSLAESWDDHRDATEYGSHCFGYGDHQEAFQQSEDCLTINVVRPSQEYGTSLPVAVYIYGGGSHGGGSSDERYNMSFIVAHAEAVGLPFIGVSFNYRAALWGFISGQEIFGSGNTNIGLYDQRLALRWVQENIKAFRGDARKVTIWGGSSGADDVGFHLVAHGGRDEGLFRAAIMQSGGPVSRTGFRNFPAQKMYDEISKRTGCDKASDSLQCLRYLPAEIINAAYNHSKDATDVMMQVLALPIVDGDLIPGYGSQLLKSSRHLRVPIMSGIVSDEGATFVPKGLQNLSDVDHYLREHHQVSDEARTRILELYETLSDREIRPVLTSDITEKQDSAYLLMALFGDIAMNAAQRLVCESFSRTASCYNFIFGGIPSWNTNTNLGATHGSEIAPLFQNFEGLGFEQNPFAGKGEGYRGMSRLMGTMWAGFISSLDPMAGLSRSPYRWPRYDTLDPGVFVFDETSTGRLIRDDYRSDAMSYLNEIQSSTFDR